MSDALQRIENQLDRIDLALVQGRIHELELGEWVAPEAAVGPDQEAQLRRVLDRVQATIARVEAAKNEAAAALEELRRRTRRSGRSPTHSLNRPSSGRQIDWPRIGLCTPPRMGPLTEVVKEPP